MYSIFTLGLRPSVDNIINDWNFIVHTSEAHRANSEGVWCIANFTFSLRTLIDNIYEQKIITMKNIIYSIKQTDFTTIITTKSGVVKVYKFDTIKQNNEYYNSII